MGKMNSWWAVFTRKSKLLRLGGSPHLSRLKARDDSATSPLYWDTSHFPAGRQVLCSCELAMALYGKANRFFMTYSKNWITLSVTLLLFQGQYTRITRCTGDFLCRICSTAPLEKVISEVNRTITRNLNCGYQNNATKTLYFFPQLLSNEAWTM